MWGLCAVSLNRSDFVVAPLFSLTSPTDDSGGSFHHLRLFRMPVSDVPLTFGCGSEPSDERRMMADSRPVQVATLDPLLS